MTVRDYMEACAALGCIVCHNLSGAYVPAHLHHPRSLAGAGQRASDWQVIPLCPRHHTQGGHGVAYHAGPQAFEAAHGSEQALLAQVRALVGIWPPEGIA